MIEEVSGTRTVLIACVLASTSLGGLALAQSTTSSGSYASQATTTSSRDETAAIKHVNDAVAVVRKMEAESGMTSLLQQAKGIFIMPTYTRVAVGVGAGGGSGVLLVKRDDGTWSDPAFYHVGGMSVGLQVGAETGPVALVLSSSKASSEFLQKNNFSLSADAGLTMVNWAVSGSAATGDVVVWASNKGLFGNVATLSVNDIRFSQTQTNAYYHQTAAVADVVSGKVRNPHADALKQALAASSTGTMGGSPGIK